MPGGVAGVPTPSTFGLCVDTVLHAVTVWSGAVSLGFGVVSGGPTAPATAVKPNSEAPQTAAVAIDLFMTYPRVVVVVWARWPSHTSSNGCGR